MSSDIRSTWITPFEGCECNLFLYMVGIICPMPQTQNEQPCWPCSNSFSEKSLKACPAWMALPMKVNAHHNEQTSSVNPSTLQDFSSRDGRQTPTVSYSCTWLALYVGWQWMDHMVPCRGVATFYGLAVNGKHDTMSKCCNILWAGSERTAWYHVECCNILWAGSERTAWYHVEVLQHFMGWQWTDSTIPCRRPDFKPDVATALNCV